MDAHRIEQCEVHLQYVERMNLCWMPTVRGKERSPVREDGKDDNDDLTSQVSRIEEEASNNVT